MIITSMNFHTQFIIYGSSKTDPVNMITFMVTTSPSKKPGEVNDSPGIGNIDTELKKCKFGYPIIQLY